MSEERLSKSQRIHGALECPICQQTIGSAVGGAAGRRAVQCSNGHPFCETCLQASLRSQEQQRRPTTCPTCRVAVKSNALIRCLVAEQLAVDVECSCSGAELGCDWQGTRGDAVAHETKCVYAKLREERSARVEADARIDKLQLALDASVAAANQQVCERIDKLQLAFDAAVTQQVRERREIRIAEERRDWQKAPLPGHHMIWKEPRFGVERDYAGRDYPVHNNTN